MGIDDVLIFVAILNHLVRFYGYPHAFLTKGSTNIRGKGLSLLTKAKKVCNILFLKY